MHAEIITTGTELLLGEIVDTNSAYIARCLRGIGLDLFYLHTVGDNEGRMADMLDQALDRCDVIITTGGLGPTVDDVARPAVARATKRDLVLMPELLTDIEAFFARTGRKMTENNRRQAYIPASAIPIHNPVGTAPAFIVEDARAIVISLPGVPREMEYLMQNEVLPYLRRRLDLSQIIKTRVLRTCSIGESTVDHLIGDLEKMSNPTVGLSAHPGQTDVRITAKSDSEAEVDRLIGEVEAQIRERLGDVIFGVDRETLEGVVAGLLRDRGRSVAVVESNTEGLIVRRLKQALEAAGVPDRLVLARVVAPSRAPIDGQAVVEEARQLLRSSGAQMALVVAGTGEANQGVWGTDPGQTHISLVTAEEEELRPFRYGGRDPHTQAWITFRALDLLRRALLGLGLDVT